MTPSLSAQSLFPGVDVSDLTPEDIAQLPLVAERMANQARGVVDYLNYGSKVLNSYAHDIADAPVNAISKVAVFIRDPSILALIENEALLPAGTLEVASGRSFDVYPLRPAVQDSILEEKYPMLADQDSMLGQPRAHQGISKTKTFRPDAPKSYPAFSRVWNDFDQAHPQKYSKMGFAKKMQSALKARKNASTSNPGASPEDLDRAFVFGFICSAWPSRYGDPEDSPDAFSPWPGFMRDITWDYGLREREESFKALGVDPSMASVFKQAMDPAKQENDPALEPDRINKLAQEYSTAAQSVTIPGIGDAARVLREKHQQAQAVSPGGLGQQLADRREKTTWRSSLRSLISSKN